MKSELAHNGRLALRYAREDRIPVFPVNPRTKAPYVKGGFKVATTDADQIIEWWTEWPDALAAAPTGTLTGFCVLDVDPGGEPAFVEQLEKLGADTPHDLTPVVGRTPSGGLHAYFTCFEGASFLSRASDIAEKIDTRGDGGYIILLGNVLPDGRAYESIGPRGSIYDAAEVPRGLLYLGTFSAKEREYIKSNQALKARIRKAHPSEWRGELEAERAREVARIIERLGPQDDDEGMRRQALHDLRVVAEEYASLQDGRRNKLFSLACRVARYVANRVLTEQEVTGALIHAAQINGALSKHGIAWAQGAIRRALVSGRNDRLPPLARMFRTDEVRA